MKLNNKGFAITAVLYGLLILFVVLVSSYLIVLSAKKDRIDNLVSDIEEGYNNNVSTIQTINLKDYITKLYLENVDKDNPVSFTAYTYEDKDNHAVSYYSLGVSLMNDGLDITGTITNDYTKGNIRYYGANPSNYIYFNCSDYSDTSTCEVWRIIGIVDGKVKIMKNQRLDATSKFASSTTTNAWGSSTIKTLLNSGTFYTELQEKNAKTLDLISSNTWYLKGSYTDNIFANSMYRIERGGTTWYGDIAILYPSDYGYAADLSVCTVAVGSYDSTNCISTNWMTSIMTNDGASYSWLITPNTESSTNSKAAWYINSDGSVGCNQGISVSYSVIPTLYLDTTLEIDSNTDGSSDNPFKLIVS